MAAKKRRTSKNKKKTLEQQLKSARSSARNAKIKADTYISGIERGLEIARRAK